MARELNPEIFGETRKAAASSPSDIVVAPSFLEEDEWKAQLNLVEQLRRKIKELESRLELENVKISDLANASKLRMDRLASSCQRMEELLKSTIYDLNEKYAQVASRMNERKINETKVEEMVNRHSHVVHNFEVRMNQLQKIISEQELQIIHTRTALADAQRELSKLKKL